MAETTEAAGSGRGGRMSRQRKRDAVLRPLRGEDLEAVSRALGLACPLCRCDINIPPGAPREGLSGRRRMWLTRGYRI